MKIKKMDIILIVVFIGIVAFTISDIQHTEQGISFSPQLEIGVYGILTPLELVACALIELQKTRIQKDADLEMYKLQNPQPETENDKTEKT